MAYKERVQILSESEQTDFYNPPILTSNDQRFLFALNDKEAAEVSKLRSRSQRGMFVVMLGYFKAKPVLLNPGYHQVKHDLKYVYQTVLPGSNLRPFNLTQKEKERIYLRILKLCDYQRWNSKSHGIALSAHLAGRAKDWSAPRNLFDEAIEYLSSQKIAIPAYSTLQKIISRVVIHEQKSLMDRIKCELSPTLKQALTDLVRGCGTLNLRQLRQSARNFTGTELAKEVTVYRHINH